MILSIDTSQFEEAKIGVRSHPPAGGSEVRSQKVFKAGRKLSERLLLQIDTLLNEEGIRLKEITAIEVNPGPGSFTGTRVGVAVANALGFVLSVPVNGQKQVEPVYGKEPSITLNKSSPRTT